MGNAEDLFHELQKLGYTDKIAGYETYAYHIIEHFQQYGCLNSCSEYIDLNDIKHLKKWFNLEPQLPVAKIFDWAELPFACSGLMLESSRSRVCGSG